MGIKKILKDPREIIYYLVAKGWFDRMPDEQYIRFMYRLRMGKKLNLEHPESFNEKLQWLKLYDHNPEYTRMVDKYEVKKYVSGLIGEQYIIPTIGVWDNLDVIDFDQLPNQFVLKCTHDSGGVVICKDKATFDKKAEKEKLQKNLDRNYFWTGREWPYKSLKPRIIAEEYLSALGAQNLVEYKIFCFNGEPKLLLVCKGEGHGSNRTNDFYDLNFNHIPVTITNPNATEKCEAPVQYEELIRLAKKLSKDIPQIRVDFYVTDSKIYFGELTFFHDSGCCHFNPTKYDEEFGKLISLPNK